MKLKSFNELRESKSFDVVQFMSYAAQHMEETMSAEDALQAILYMLGGKAWKYVKEAHLGGMEGLEIEEETRQASGVQS